MRGDPLMPCTQRKARILLKEGKAVIYKYNPFTIQLTHGSQFLLPVYWICQGIWIGFQLSSHDQHPRECESDL
ncbi:hypothetical protein G4358_00665 [Dorea formicigenerans]|uniref:RRXRR domain-containing protein n=1 Tax=Dorea formicigenerans TaxID=39486 RepID=A0A395XLN6_9FIRM|nr:hypothetical protein [Dorea formicigenerans]RGW51898.1 hypothetical protein DWV67_10930 [Dorea formicigenerans]RHA02291.1 hypothetical protein DW957_01275 [Dorea formicigenerans]